MNLITSFISHAVQPGTSFATTPTLLAFKEIYIIATRFVETQTGEKMKGLPKSDDPAEADFISSSGVRLFPDESLFSDLNTQATSLFVSSRFQQQLPRGSSQSISTLYGSNTHNMIFRLLMIH
jgi:hypothetical protein